MPRSIGSYRFNDVSIAVNVSTETFSAGGTEEVTVHMTDRTKRWEITGASLAIDVYYATEDGHETERVTSVTVSEDLPPLTDLVEVRRVPLSLPGDVPNTIGSVDVAARITFESDRNSADYEEFLAVGPRRQFQGVLASMVDLGFVLRNSECRADRTAGGRDFVQVLTFDPRDGRFHGDVGAVDLFVRTGEESTTVAVDVDPGDDRYAVPRDDARTTLSAADPERVRPELERLLERTSPA